MSKTEEFLIHKVKGILKPMLSAVLSERPNDQVRKKIIIFLYKKYFRYLL